MLSSIFMLVSRRVIIKIIVIVGIVLYNWLILHYHVIIPNFYSLREWLGVLGGVIALLAV
jgi:hypothetical protein